jgi:hypothetical protein
VEAGAFAGAWIAAPDELEMPDALEFPEVDEVDADGVVVSAEPSVAVGEELDGPGNWCATTPTINATAVTAPAVVQRNARRTRSNATPRCSLILA